MYALRIPAVTRAASQFAEIQYVSGIYALFTLILHIRYKNQSLTFHVYSLEKVGYFAVFSQGVAVAAFIIYLAIAIYKKQSKCKFFLTK